MRQQLIERIETLHGQEAKLADLIVDAPNAAALVTKLKTVQAEREQAEAELTEEEQVARDLNTNTDLIDQLRDGRLTSWVEQKATHPETANARLKSILATPVAVVPEGEGRKRIWTFLGLSRLDGALVGQLNGDTVLVALQPGDGQVARLRVTLPERDAAALVAGWQTPISGGSDAPVSTGRGLTGGEQGRGPEWRRTPGALGAPWRSRGALDAAWARG